MKKIIFTIILVINSKQVLYDMCIFFLIEIVNIIILIFIKLIFK